MCLKRDNRPGRQRTEKGGPSPKRPRVFGPMPSMVESNTADQLQKSMGLRAPADPRAFHPRKGTKEGVNGGEERGARRTQSSPWYLGGSGLQTWTV